MTREEAIKIINCYDIGFYDLSGEKIPADKLAEAFHMAIEALKDKPTRKYKLNDETEICLDEESYEIGYSHGQRADRLTGEWLEVEVFPEVYDIEGVKTWGSEMQCDQCGFRHMAIEGRMAQYNYCPNCGADMRGK